MAEEGLDIKSLQQLWHPRVNVTQAVKNIKKKHDNAEYMI